MIFRGIKRLIKGKPEDHTIKLEPSPALLKTITDFTIYHPSALLSLLYLHSRPDNSLPDQIQHPLLPALQIQITTQRLHPGSLAVLDDGGILG